MRPSTAAFSSGVPEPWGRRQEGELGRLAKWKGCFQNARMFPRSIITTLHAAAARFPIVVVLGARQVGKTTLARAAFKAHRYVDLEDPRTAERFRQDARFELDAGAGAGLILDEAQAVPSVFGALRGAVDAQRARLGRFIVLGSAQPALVRGVSESLAGRAAVIELDPLTAQEAEQGPDAVAWSQVWLKGGFPDALRGDSRAWWESCAPTRCSCAGCSRCWRISMAAC
jgi:predicted AAA+ superfamily ATPase